MDTIENLECWLKKAQEIARMGNWDQDPETGQLWWSDQTYRLFGLDPQGRKMTFDDFISYVHPDDRELIINNTELALKSDEYPYRSEYRITLPNQLERYVFEEAHIERDNDGKATKIIGIIQDITERKRVELEKLERLNRKKRFETLSMLAYEPLVIHKNGVIVDINASALDLFGYSEAEMIGQNAIELLFPRETHTLLYKSIAITKVAPYETVARRKNGTLFSIEIESRNVQIETETFRVTALRDVTRRKQLATEREQLQQAIDQSGETIVMTDAAGTIQYVNPTFEKITGYRLSEALGQNPSILKSGRHDEAFYQAMWETLTQGKTWSGKLFNKRKDGSFYTEEATISPVFDGLGDIVNYISVKRDITHQEEMEEQLRQKHKLEALGTMAGGMAHNFNNNLAIILGNLELCQYKLPQDSPLHDHLKHIKTAVIHSRDLVRKINTYSRLDGQASQPMSLSDNVTGTINLLSSTIPRTVNQHHNLNANSDDIIINGVSSQLEEILVNLCNNAVQAMTEKGDLTITLESVELSQDDIFFPEEAVPGRYAKLSVQDTGPGISEENKGKIFDLFFTTKDVDEGTGVGLSTVQGIVDQHHGFIVVNSALGHGTTFEIFIPQLERRKKDRSTKNHDLLRGDEKILFLDDEEVIVEIWSQILSEQGYQVTSITNSVEALELFKDDPEQFDLLVTDQTMPDMSGSELITELLKIKPTLAMILCTGHSSMIDEEAALALGVKDFCEKPLERQGLLQIIRNVLDQNS